MSLLQWLQSIVSLESGLVSILISNFLIVFTGIIPQLVEHSPNTVLMIVSNPGNNGQ